MLTDERIRKIALNAGFGGISDSDVELCRAVEAEARREALEEAIAACVGYGESLDNEWNRNLGVAAELREACEDCAAAIRALKEKP